MSTIAADERIGRAWRMHREGNNNGAIAMFQEVIGANPDDVDAHYGLGLALKAVGDASAAKDAFSAALGLMQGPGAVQALENVESHHADTNAGDRHMMLSRMINQRLADLGAS